MFSMPTHSEITCLNNMMEVNNTTFGIFGGQLGMPVVNWPLSVRRLCKVSIEHFIIKEIPV